MHPVYRKTISSYFVSKQYLTEAHLQTFCLDLLWPGLLHTCPAAKQLEGKHLAFRLRWAAGNPGKGRMVNTNGQATNSVSQTILAYFSIAFISVVTYPLSLMMLEFFLSRVQSFSLQKV